MPPATRATPRSYRSERRSEQARQTRRRVLAAATTVFLTRGYAGASMRMIATEASVSIATVEQLFGTKAAILKAAIDVAIAGDDEAVPMLERPWRAEGEQLTEVSEFLALVAEVLTPAQERSAGLVLAVLEAAPTDADLAELSDERMRQRRGTAQWIVETLQGKTALRPELSLTTAVDTLWILMDPAIFDRLVRQCHWPVTRYQTWFAESARRLLVPDPPIHPSERNHDEPQP